MFANNLCFDCITFMLADVGLGFNFNVYCK